MTNALQRVIRRPGLLAALWAAQLALGVLFSQPVRASIRAVMGDFALLDDGFFMANLLTLVGEHRGLAPQIAVPAIGGILIGAVGWTVVAGGVITKLASPGSRDGFFATAGRWLPAMVVTSFWHGLLRLVVLGLIVAGSFRLPGVASALIIAPFVAFLTCTLDIARVSVVLHGGRPHHPQTVVIALAQALHHPAVLLRSITLTLLQWALLGLMAYLAVLGLFDGTGVLAGRILLLPLLVIGLWRIAVVVDAGRLQVRSEQ